MNQHVTAFLLGAGLCLVVSLESIAIKWVKTVQSVDPPTEQLIILVETIKILVSYGLYHEPEPATTDIENNNDDDDSKTSMVEQSSDDGDDDGDDDEIVMPRRRNSLWFFVFPAVLYGLANNITLFALTFLSSSMFILLMSLKIPLTGIIAWIFLHKRITPLGWFALTIMFAGSALASLRFHGWIPDGLDAATTGIVLMIVYCTCSSSAGVYMEYVTRYRFASEHLLVQNVKFAFLGVLFNTCVAVFRGTIFDWNLEPLHYLIALSMAVNGFVTAAVIKFAGSIVKTYSVSMAALLTNAFAIVVFHEILGWNFYVGATMCSAAIQLYAYDKIKHHA